MKKLFRFLYGYRNLLVFLLLEFLSLALIFNYSFQAKFEKFSSSNSLVGNIYILFSRLRNYPHLNETYNRVLSENSYLKEQLLQSSLEVDKEKYKLAESGFKFIPAQVINNSIIHTKNYITLNKGRSSGILPGMGVVAENGIVGSVKKVSEHFCTVVSLLHTDVYVSAKFMSSNTMGTIRWSGHSPVQAQLLYIPRHLKVEVGDQVVTSGYDTSFYAGISIGTVCRVELNKESSFYDIAVELSTDFSTLQYVYVLENNLKLEKETLEQATKEYYE